MRSEIDLQSTPHVQSWVTQWMVDELNLDPDVIDIDRAFLSYGMDSMRAMMLVGDLESGIGIRLSPTLAWDYPSIRALAQHIVEIAASAPAGGSDSGEVRPTPSRTRGEADARAVLAQLDGMAEEEIDELLQEYMTS